MRILFMGSGDFAMPILTKLIQTHNVCAVYTASFLQQNTRKNIENPIEILSIKNNIPLYKVDKITNEIIFDIKKYNPELIVVASFGFILPEDILEIGSFYKPINIHPSMLPKWRGAAPIERTIESGDIKTAVCIIKMVKKMDAGNILIKQELEIDGNITSMELRNKTAEIGSDLLLNWIEKPIFDGESQNENNVIFANKIKKEELLLDFNLPVNVVYNKIRAFNSFGGCFFIHNNERIKIWKANFIIENNIKSNFFDIKNNKIYCLDGYISPILMQREGKKILSAKDVCRGL